MGLLDYLEKLINEHGSAAILRDHIALVKTEHSALERSNSDLAAENKELRERNAKLEEDGRLAQRQVSALQSSNPNGYVCDHCGNSNLTRTGSRKDAAFGDMGIKEAVFSCQSCGKESAFTQIPSS